MHRLVVSTLLIIWGSACSLQRVPIVEPAIDAPGLDAPGLDAPGLDAGRDAPGLDAGRDAGMDAPIDVSGFDAGDVGMVLPDVPTMDVPLDVPPDVPVDVPPDVPTDARCSTGPDRDGDGVVDVCDRCPDDNPDDTDGDGTCDSMDRCPGNDDRLDADGDGIPDGCDDWPCGVRPTPTSPVSANGVTISSLSLGGGGPTAVLAPGATVSALVNYSIQDCACDGCLDQIEIGVVPGPRAFCAYDGNPPTCPASATGSRMRNITAPATPGTYDVRFRLAQDFSCNYMGRTDWWLAPPGETGTIGVICVQ